jgi:phage-related protein
MKELWQVVFYIDEGGKEPVKEFVLGQTSGAIAEILHVFKLLREFNITLRMPYVRKVHESGIRELRIKHGSDSYRIFFFAHGVKKFILLHAIKKKEDKTPKEDIALAISRMNNYIENH